MLTMRWGDMGDSFTKNQWLIDLEARTNVKINWQTVSNTDWEEQKNILLAGGELLTSYSAAAPSVMLTSRTTWSTSCPWRI